MSQHVPTMIPMQILADIDNSRNPMQLSRDRLERAATENQFMNGKIQAIKVRISIIALSTPARLSQIATVVVHCRHSIGYQALASTDYVVAVLQRLLQRGSYTEFP